MLAAVRSMGHLATHSLARALPDKAAGSTRGIPEQRTISGMTQEFPKGADSTV
jgi:hypothetical protein